MANPRAHQGRILLLALLLLALAAGCNEPKKASSYNNGPRFAQVAVGMSGHQAVRKRSNAGLAPHENAIFAKEAQTILIFAVPAGTPFSNDYHAVAPAMYDGQLLNLATSTVTLTLPMDTPIQLFEYTFNQVYDLGQLQASPKMVLSSAVLPAFTITDATTSLNLVADLALATPPDGLFLVADTAALIIGGTRQVYCIATFPDGSTQEITPMCEFSSSDAATLTVDNSTSKGLVTALLFGSATITAKYDTLSTTMALSTSATAGSMADYFQQFMAETTHQVEMREERGALYAKRNTTTWNPFSSTEFRWDHLTNNWANNSGNTLVLSGGVWAPKTAKTYNVTSIDQASYTLYLQPDNLVVSLMDARPVAGGDIFFNWSYSEPDLAIHFGNPAAFAYQVLISMDEPLAYYLWETEKGYDGSTDVTYTSLNGFIEAHNDTSTDGPFSCNDYMTGGGSTCIWFETDMSNDTTGNLIQVSKDSMNNIIAGPSIAGTWNYQVVDGQNLLLFNPYDQSYTHGSAQAYFSMYNGLVWRGGTWGGGSGAFISDELNAAALDDITNFLRTLDPLYFQQDSYGGSYGGCDPSTDPSCDTSTGGSYGAPTSPVHVPEMLALNGSSDYLKNSDAVLGFAQQFTISIWFSLNNAALTGTILDISLSGGGNANRMLVHYDGAGNVQFSAYSGVGAIWADVDLLASAPLQQDTLYHLVITGDSTIPQVNSYLNGKYVSSTVYTLTAASVVDLPRSIFVGSDFSPANFFPGNLHSLAIWDRALVGDEVGSLMYSDQGMEPMENNLEYGFGMYNPTGLLHWYQFTSDPVNPGADYATSVYAVDAISDRRPLTLMGTYTTTPTPGYMTGGQLYSALMTPNGGEFWASTALEYVNWDPMRFGGSTISIYYLSSPGDTTPLDEGGAWLTAAVNQFGGMWMSAGTAPVSAGSFAFDMNSMGLFADKTRILIVDDWGYWDISDHNFSGGINISPTNLTGMTADGSDSDWTGASPVVYQDNIYDDQDPLNEYTGDDFSELYFGEDTGLQYYYLGIRLTEPLNTNFQYGTSPGTEGAYFVRLNTSTGFYDIGIAYNPGTLGWEAGYNGLPTAASAMAGGGAGTGDFLELEMDAMMLGTIYSVQVRFDTCCAGTAEVRDTIYLP